VLPADQRLRKNEEFRLVYKRGRENVHPLAVLYVMRRVGNAAMQIPGRRIGFVVSKKQGNAVVRNRIKRRLRESMRLRLNELKPGAYDLVFVARGRLKTADWPEIQEAMRVLLQRAGVLKEGT
jgi:ribonuclease P protein component